MSSIDDIDDRRRPPRRGHGSGPEGVRGRAARAGRALPRVARRRSGAGAHLELQPPHAADERAAAILELALPAEREAELPADRVRRRRSRPTGTRTRLRASPRPARGRSPAQSPPWRCRGPGTPAARPSRSRTPASRPSRPPRSPPTRRRAGRDEHDLEHARARQLVAPLPVGELLGGLRPHEVARHRRVVQRAQQRRGRSAPHGSRRTSVSSAAIEVRSHEMNAERIRHAAAQH